MTLAFDPMSWRSAADPVGVGVAQIGEVENQRRRGGLAGLAERGNARRGEPAVDLDGRSCRERPLGDEQLHGVV